MPGQEVIPEIVQVAADFVPALRTVPLLRGLIVPLQHTGHHDETKALEEYQNAGKRDQEKRTKLKKKYNKHVIKISDAMTCVESSVFDGKIAFAFGKALLSIITGGTTATPDLLFDAIAQCMIRKMLQQNNKRTLGKFQRTKGGAYAEPIKIRKGKLHPDA